MSTFVNCDHITAIFRSNLPPEKGVMANHDVMTCCNSIHVDFKYLIGSSVANWQNTKTIFYLEGSKIFLFLFGPLFEAPHFRADYSEKKRTPCYTHRKEEIPSIYNLPAFEMSPFSDACKTKYLSQFWQIFADVRDWVMPSQKI